MDLRIYILRVKKIWLYGSDKLLVFHHSHISSHLAVNAGCSDRRAFVDLNV
jgi:hypothetical protein